MPRSVRPTPGSMPTLPALPLRALEADGIVERTVHAQVPPHVDYRLSAYGWTLGPLLDRQESPG